MLFATGTALNETEPVPVENNVLATEANKEVYHYKKIKTFIFFTTIKYLAARSNHNTAQLQDPLL